MLQWIDWSNFSVTITFLYIWSCSFNFDCSYFQSSLFEYICILRIYSVCLYVYIAKRTTFIKRDELFKCDIMFILYHWTCVPFSKQISGANDLKNDLSFWWTWVLRGDNDNSRYTINPGKSLFLVPTRTSKMILKAHA